MIRLSIVMPSNRDSLAAFARIAQACSWAGPQTEVIIRDNSGSPSKGRLLAQIQKDNCHIIVSDPCEAHENWAKAFEQAKGEFVFFLSDDDTCFDRAIADLPKTIEAVGHDPSVVGVTGTTFIDATQGASFVDYPNVDADDAPTRLSGYLSSNSPNVILFSPARRAAMKWVMEIINAKPFQLSFDDQLSSMLYLLRGKYARLNRILFCYDPHHWEKAETAQREDLKFYTAAKLDPAINKLHWLLCAFEGACLIRNLALTPNYSLAQRQIMADRWFAVMFNRFKSHGRADFGSPLSANAEILCAKWTLAAGQLSFAALLADICQFLALSSQENSLKYFAFWSTIIGLRQAPAA